MDLTCLYTKKGMFNGQSSISDTPGEVLIEVDKTSGGKNPVDEKRNKLIFFLF